MDLQDVGKEHQLFKDAANLRSEDNYYKEVVIDLESPHVLPAYTISDLQGAFYILMIMLTISFVAFL